LKEQKKYKKLLEFLKKSEKYTATGVRQGLTCGTSWDQCSIEAVAGEAQVPFLLSGSDFVEMFVGV
jgi:ATP-dependent Zn protease